MLTIEKISRAAENVAGEYGIKKVILFGSYASGENTEDSDVDLLVEFETEAVSLLTLSALKIDFETALEKEVDVIRLPVPEGSLIRPEKVVEIYAS